MILNRLNPREKKIFYVVMALVVFMIGYHGVWQPILNKSASLDDEIFAAEMRLRKAKTLLRQRDDVLEEAKKYPNLAKMDAGTDEAEIAKLLNLIEQTARKTGITLADVKPEPVQSDKMTKRYRVELDAEAGLEQLMEFIYELESSPELLKIERVETAPREDNPSAMRTSLAVTRVVVK